MNAFKCKFTLKCILLAFLLTAIFLTMFQRFGKEHLETYYALRKLRKMGAGHVQFDKNGKVVVVHFERQNINLDGIQDFDSIQCLHFATSGIGGEQLANLSDLKNLRLLDLSFTRIGDEDFRRIGSLPRLTYLRVDHTQLSDLTLSKLANFPNLAGVDVTGTQVSSNAVSRHQILYPNVKIVGARERRPAKETNLSDIKGTTDLESSREAGDGPE
jgi:Leucine-rich repeat (LRR) protein